MSQFVDYAAWENICIETDFLTEHMQKKKIKFVFKYENYLLKFPLVVSHFSVKGRASMSEQREARPLQSEVTFFPQISAIKPDRVCDMN